MLFEVLQCLAGLDQPIPSQLNPAQSRPGLGTYEPTQRGLYSSCFPSIRYTQGKQEGIRMGPDRHLVCWEISLGRSERLPSPLPAPAHQMWGEGHIASSLCLAAWVRSLSLCFPSHWTAHVLQIHATLSLIYMLGCTGMNTDTYKHRETVQDKIQISTPPLLIFSLSVFIEYYSPQV